MSKEYNKEKPNYYAIIPANVRYDNNLTANAKLLYAEITALCNMNGNCTASSEYFAKLYNVSRVSIQKWLSQLEKNGYINRKVTYKKGSKQIDTRYITIIYNPSKEKFTTPSKEKFTDNNNISKDIYKNNNITYSNNSIVSFSGSANVVIEAADITKEVIDHLNQVAKTNYKSSTPLNRKYIKARVKEGFTLEDFKTVIENKTRQWSSNSDMVAYLRPQTLFGTNMESYLNEPKPQSRLDRAFEEMGL